MLGALILIDSLDPDYVAWLFEGTGKELLASIVEEAAHGTRAIRMDVWRSVIIPIPPKPEQQAIASFLVRKIADVDMLVSKVCHAIERLKEFRIALISAAVTGKIDVREEVA